MAIATVWQLDMKEVRQMIAEALSLPDDLVLDANDEIDVTKYKHFITVLASYQNELGSQRRYDGVNEVEILSNVSELTISVNAYGLNAYQMISKLALTMKLTPIYQMQRKLRIGFLRASQVRNLPTTISAGKEQRAQVDLIFSINHIIKADILRGDSVQIKTEVN